MATQNFSRRDLVEDYKNGFGFSKIRDKYGLSRPAARKILVEEGVTIRGKGRPFGAKNRKKQVEPVASSF
jgi:hypothetical protein